MKLKLMGGSNTGIPQYEQRNGHNGENQLIDLSSKWWKPVRTMHTLRTRRIIDFIPLSLTISIQDYSSINGAVRDLRKLQLVCE